MKEIKGVMLNAYPDSCGGTLGEMVKLLAKEDFKDVFSLFYLLPSLFQSDLDRGFSVVSYDLNEELCEAKDLADLQDMDLELLLDFVLNHLSVQSPQFKDLLEKGDDSKYIDFFIDWNKFWEGKGKMSPEGYMVPQEEYLSKLFMRKPGLPILKLPFPDGSTRFYWNTFYQKVTEEEEGSSYLGQMDLNGESPLVWDFYEETLKKFKNYGGRIVRLDAFAYLHKEVGESNFFNEPGTWDYLDRIREMADSLDLILLPEIHTRHEEGVHTMLAEKGYPIYDFFFPGLVFHTIETGETEDLLRWIGEIREKGYQTVNMLGCHDGIPVLDVKGLLDDSKIENMMSLIQSRGGRVKDLYGPDGKKIAYYQINATFFSAFGESEAKLLLARAMQIFMPGTPLVWYLDLFAGTNDYEAADTIGHKDINRTNLSIAEVDEKLEQPVVQKQLKLLRFRNSFPAFSPDSDFSVKEEAGILTFQWEKGGYSAMLTADPGRSSFVIRYKEPDGEWKNL